MPFGPVEPGKPWGDNEQQEKKISLLGMSNQNNVHISWNNEIINKPGSGKGQNDEISAHFGGFPVSILLEDGCL